VALAAFMRAKFAHNWFQPTSYALYRFVEQDLSEFVQHRFLKRAARA